MHAGISKDFYLLPDFLDPAIHELIDFFGPFGDLDNIENGYIMVRLEIIQSLALCDQFVTIAKIAPNIVIWKADALADVSISLVVDIPGILGGKP